VYKISFKHTIIQYFGTAGLGDPQGQAIEVSSKQGLCISEGRDDIKINRQRNALLI